MKASRKIILWIFWVASISIGTRHTFASCVSLFKKVHVTDTTENALSDAKKLHSLVKKLTTSLGILTFVRYPIRNVVIALENNKHPHVEINHGTISINRKLLALTKSDDELAAVIGAKLLHHSLEHESMILKEMDEVRPFDWTNSLAKI